MQNEELFKEMAQSIIDGEAEKAAELANQAVNLGIDPLDAINNGFVAGVDHVGEQFSCGMMFLPELVMAGEAMKSAVAVPNRNSPGGVPNVMLGRSLCTVEGDIHEIVKTGRQMLSATGFGI
jgi:methanogenic corrinoid protein MtbC1